ncbi:MAG TPA: hypothetical protein VFP39_08335 [Gemmatimonadales bacterium]|nr:hypothetical protein [Gemmatimonadales bacterium]
MYLRHLIVSLAIIGMALSGSATAQTPDSLRFHRGQWGVEFNIANGFFGAGALHFTSPTHAWLAVLDGEYAHDHASGPLLTSSNATSVAIELGTRGYHSFSPRLYRVSTLGVSLNYSRQTANGGPTLTAEGVGLFGDLGATWLVTPHLGIGARWRASVAYAHGKATVTGSTTTSDIVTLSAATVLLTGQIYF